VAQDNEFTFRERIMRHWVTRFQSQKKAEGARVEWDVVTRKPLTKADQMLGDAIGIYDTSERATKEIGYDVRVLNVVFEFHHVVRDWETDDVPSALNAVLGEVQRVAGIDHQLGEPDPNNPTGPSYKLAINCEEQGNEIDIGGEKPSSVTGVVIMRITYRTKSNNPFRR
jgi:hypothetical protein